MRVKKGLLSSVAIIALTAGVSATAPGSAPSVNSRESVEARSVAYDIGTLPLTSLTVSAIDACFEASYQWRRADLFRSLVP